MPATSESSRENLKHWNHFHPDVLGDTEVFYRKFFEDLPMMDRKRLLWRMDFLMEEITETASAIERHDPEEIVDGLVDMMVVIMGTFHEARINFGKAWSRVHDANMQKVRGEKDTRAGSFGYDLIKPDGWEPPKHHDNHGVLDVPGFAKNAPLT
jgi:predicted HAD superfamily Cof-like phosphohydrolase